MTKASHIVCWVIRDRNGHVFPYWALTQDEVVARHVHELWSDPDGKFGVLSIDPRPDGLDLEQSKAWKFSRDEGGHEVVRAILQVGLTASGRQAPRISVTSKREVAASAAPGE